MTIQEYEKIYAIELDANCINFMTHSLGLTNKLENSRTQSVEVCRNYFAGCTTQSIKTLIKIGFMKEIRHEYYVVTKAGVIWLQYHFDKIIKFRDFEDVYE